MCTPPCALLYVPPPCAARSSSCWWLQGAATIEQHLLLHCSDMDELIFLSLARIAPPGSKTHMRHLGQGALTCKAWAEAAHKVPLGSRSPL